MWCHWWPTYWSVHFTTTSDRWYLRQPFANELPTLLENVPLQTRLQMCYQNDGAPSHLGQDVRQYLNHRFPNRRIGRGGAQNWPPRDLNPLDDHVWGYLKLCCVHTRWTREKNYSCEFSALQEASTTLQCFVSLQVLWSHESENLSKQMEDTSNNLSECSTANL